MSLWNRKQGGFMDEIRCDEPSYLIWKWHPKGRELGDNNRENAIRWGSSLRVKDGEVAVFVYNREDGIHQDYIVGPYDGIVDTKNFPILASIVGLAYDGGTPFQAEVYYINLAKIVQVKFGVPFFDVYDPRFLDFAIPVAVRGTISFSISDYKEFVQLHRLSNFNLNDFQKQIRDATNRYVKDVIANIPAQHNIPVIQIETKISQINDVIEYDLSQRLTESFGVNVSGIDVGAIEIDKSSDGFRELMKVTKDVISATIEAETAAKVKDIADRQRIDVKNYDETLRIQREEGQYAVHKQTQSANMGAFQVEKQAEVGTAGAEALGKMGSNGAGDINLGSGGFNMAALITNMAVGGAVGKNIAKNMNDVMSSMSQSTQTEITPPPVPTTAYYVAVNGQAVGPFDLKVLSEMATSGQLTQDTLVWRNGLTEWIKAESTDDLKALFPNIPPIPAE